MKIHTTNYESTFIQVSEDCPVTNGEIPPVNGDKRTVANIQYETISRNPYKFTSDDVLFKVYAERNDLIEPEHEEARTQFFAKGQPCFRASPLTKRYGWGIHNNKEGKIALFSSDSEEYKTLSSNENLKVIRAVRSAKLFSPKKL